MRRAAVKKLKSKAYFSDTQRAVSAVPSGMIGAVGTVKGQRVALLKNAVVTDVATHDSVADKQALYRQVAQGLTADEIGVFDADFKLIEAAATGIERCVSRLALNCTFGKTPGAIPERTATTGRTPTQYPAEIVRPLARTHKGYTLPAHPADEICTLTDEVGQDIKVYFLERHLKRSQRVKRTRCASCPSRS